MQTRLVEEPVSYKKKRSKFIEYFDSIKKPFDMTDDAWNLLRYGVLPAKIVDIVAPFLISVVLGVIHFAESCHAAQDAYYAYMNKKLAQRNTRLYTNLLAFIFAGSGMGLSVSLFIGALSAIGVIGSVTLLGLAYYPIVIPALLTGIYSLKLYRVGYRFHRAKKAEMEAEKEQNPEKSEAAHQHRLMAERSVAFSTLEVLGSVLVGVGITLGVLAVLGSASIASFGALPFGLLLAGVCIGTVSGYFKNKDKEHKFEYTNTIRNFFIKEPIVKIKHIKLPPAAEPKKAELPKNTDNSSIQLTDTPVVTSPDINSEKDDSSVLTQETSVSSFGLTRK